VTSDRPLPRFYPDRGSLILPIPREVVGLDDRQVRFQGKVFDPKGEPHITLVGKSTGRRLLEARAADPTLENRLRQVIEGVDWSYRLTNAYYHLAEERPRGGAGQTTLRIPAESIIQMVELPGLTAFYQHLNEWLLADPLPLPPAHVTLYTYAWPFGIGLRDADEFANLVTGPVDPAGLEPLPPRAYSDLYEEALRLAATAHEGQLRKCSDIPYLTHLVQVAGILAHYGFSREVTIAGLLHDIVEDQDYPLEKIAGQFGQKVAAIVDDLSERKLDEMGRMRPWEVRKQEGVEQMGQSGLESVAVKVADSLHNVRGLVFDLSQQGPVILACFKRGPEAILNNYQEVLAAAQEQMPGHPLVVEYEEAVALLAAVLAGAIEQQASWE
jgi:hypothetical protein